MKYLASVTLLYLIKVCDAVCEFFCTYLARDSGGGGGGGKILDLYLLYAFIMEDIISANKMCYLIIP